MGNHFTAVKTLVNKDGTNANAVAVSTAVDNSDKCQQEAILRLFHRSGRRNSLCWSAFDIFIQVNLQLCWIRNPKKKETVVNLRKLWIH